jgi:hypothetical protein
VELAQWTFPIIALCREPYEAKVSRTGLTGGMGRRTVRQRALCLPSKAVYTGTEESKEPKGEVRQVAHGQDVKVREMRSAETLLDIIHDRGKRPKSTQQGNRRAG